MNKATADFNEYLLHVKAYSPKTADSYIRDVEKFLAFASKEGVLFDQVDVIIIRNFLTKEIDDGISKRSCKRRLSALKLFYNFCIEHNYAKGNPFIFIESPKIDKTYPSFLHKEDIANLFAENAKRTDILAARDQAILMLLYEAGLRASELVNLTIQDVNLKDRIVRVIGKGNKERLVPFFHDCTQALTNYIKKSRPYFAMKNPQLVSVLFLNSKGHQLTTRGLEYILDQIELKTSVFVGLHPHILRHSIATKLLDSGDDLRYIQEFLGHASINATQVYTHVTEEAMKKEYNVHPRAHHNDKK